jgi:prepilin-type N-terminal cleavage/methylation domain-containing protein/prepilin-type processing-associated H-X9-DG protein
MHPYPVFVMQIALCPHSSNRSSGFTLVELLVVIALLGVLISLMLPAFSQAIHRARDVQCLANLHAVGGGFMSMLGDHGNRLVTHMWRDHRDNVWPMQLLDGGYIGAKNLIYCQKSPPRFEGNRTEEAWWAHMAGYGINFFDRTVGGIQYSNNKNRADWKANYNKVRDPSNYWLLGDSYYSEFDTTYYKIPNERADPLGAHLRHSAGTAANVFFIDGHVRPCDPARLHQLGLQRFFSEDKQVIQ